MCALVGGETATESDEQCIGINSLEYRDCCLRVTAVADPPLTVEGTYMLNETELDRLMRLPEYVARDLLYLSPCLFACLMAEVILPKILRI